MDISLGILGALGAFVVIGAVVVFVVKKLKR